MKLLLQIFKTMQKSEFCVLIKHCFLIGKNTVQAKQLLDKCYSDSALLKTMFKRWCADFKCGHTHTNDAECLGCLNLAFVQENTKNFHKFILQEHLSMRKLCSKWVLRLLTVDQKQRINNSEHCLQQFQCNKNEFSCKYVTMDETWIQHFTLESNWQSAEWTAAGESHPKQLKTQTSTGKVLASVFWDVQGILSIDYLEKGRTINSKYYITLSVWLKDEITKKRPQMKKKKWSFTRKMHHVTCWLQRW